MTYLLDANFFILPNVCMGLGPRFMTPYEMLRREQAQFVLGKV